MTRYSLVTPKRPEATCLMALRRESPLASGTLRAGSSPPSPVFDLAPIRFIAIASVSCASWLIEPKDIAPVEKRLTMALDRFDLVERHRRPAGLKREQPAQRGALPALVVDQLRVLLEDLVLAGARGVLQAEHGLRVEQVDLAVPAPLVLAAAVELDLAPAARRPKARA